MGSEGEDGDEILQFSPKTKKIIQNLKEILNSSELEIYAALKDCNMDPNEAVQRLLSQDTFHEVKSKRERRKEMKEAQESRFTYCSADYGVRSVNERNVGEGGSTQISFNGYCNVAYKDDGELTAPSPSYPPKTMNEQLSYHSAFLNTTGARSRIQCTGTTDNLYMNMQPSPRSQPVWSGTTAEHLSMADVVKLDKLPYKDVVAKPSDVFLCQPESLYNSHSQNPSSIHEWPVVVDQPAGPNRSLILDESVTLDVKKGFNVSKHCQSDGIQLSEAGVIDESLSSDQTASASTAGGQIILTDVVKSLDNGDSSCYDHAMPMYGHVEGAGSGSNLLVPNHSKPLPDDPTVAGSSATSNVENLSLGKAEKEDSCALILPSHVQALAADCSHLSFGTYKPGASPVLFRQTDTNQSTDDCEGTSRAMNGLSIGNPDTRNAEHNSDKSLESIYDARGAPAASGKYDFLSSFQPELVKQDALEANPGHEFFKSSANYSGFQNVELECSRFSSTRSGLDMAYEMALKNRLSLSEMSSILPQSLAVHQYSQKFPKEDLVNMVGYPSHLRSHSHLQSTQLQVCRDGGEFQQSLDDMDYGLPQHRGGSLISRLAPSPNAAYGYGTLNMPGSNLHLPGSNLHSGSASLMINRNGYKDTFHPLNNGVDHFTNQQITCSSSLNHGVGLRMKTPPFPDDSCYTSLGHNQYHAGYQRDNLLPAQHYAALGYPNAYQQQRLDDMTLGSTQNLLQEQLELIFRQNH